MLLTSGWGFDSSRAGQAHHLSHWASKLGETQPGVLMKKLQSLYADPDHMVVHACMVCLVVLPFILAL